MKKVHLICNAHLDPVWLWEWEEGAAEAISTFRTAADLCEAYDGFIFNHNEVVLYQWVEEYDPALFKRIQGLVRAGKWHIMGGWYLQPDCNMPSGESFVRQILLGKTYFRKRFGVEPTTAINFDPFGHSRGLVQILKKSGYDAYLFCRPGERDCLLPGPDFTWVGFDGSEVTGHRTQGWYCCPRGKAGEKVEDYLREHGEKEVGLVLWGVGNHGGGPSRKDLDRLRELTQSREDAAIIHSTPERYFEELRASGAELPRHEGDINPWGVGCYTSQVRIKQKHRELENGIYALEKMAANAAIQGLVPYPREVLSEALSDLMLAEFHDILPGSSVQPVEEAALRLLDHGLEVVSRRRARTFFALASGQAKADEGTIPIFVYNPHPFPVRTVVACEFQIADANWEEQFTAPIVHQAGQPIPCQTEREHGNLNLDWRKRPVFLADLAPSSMNRFDCTLEVLPERPKPALRPENGLLAVKTDDIEVQISTATGLIERYAVDGVDYLKHGAFRLLVIDDNEDPWGMLVQSFRDAVGGFELMPPEEGTRFSGVSRGAIDSVRVIEDGAVRAVIESVFRYADSFAVVRYGIPKQGSELEIEIRVFWSEKSRMLKLSVPTTLADARFLGQTAFGVQDFPTTGREAAAQKWMAVVSEQDARGLTCINDGTYGADCAEGELRLSLVRSPAYSGHPIGKRPIVPQDRFRPRIDQGERVFRFWLNAGPSDERLAKIEREALVRNEKPFALSFFPDGSGEAPKPGLMLDDDVVQLSAFKQAEDGEGYIIRLYEPTGSPLTTTLSIPALGFEQEVALGGFEVKSLRLRPAEQTLAEVDMLERPVSDAG